MPAIEESVKNIGFLIDLDYRFSYTSASMDTRAKSMDWKTGRDLKHYKSPPPPMTRAELFTAGVGVGFVGTLLITIIMANLLAVAS